MAAVTAGIITAGAGLLGDFMSQQGQSGANAMNMAIAQDQMAFQKQSQEQAEQYNTEMSDTAEQRRVADLRAAGLNPMLAVTAGAASAPTMSGQSGASQTMQNPDAAFGQLGAQTAAGVNSWLNTAQTQSNIAQQQAQTDKTNAEADLARSQAFQASANNPYAASNARANARNLDEQTNVLKSTWHKFDSDWDLNINRSAGLMQDQAFQRQLFPLQQQTQELDIQRQRYGLPSLKAQADWWSGLSPEARSFAAGLSQMAPAVSSAAGAARHIMGAGGALNFLE